MKRLIFSLLLVPATALAQTPAEYLAANGVNGGYYAPYPDYPPNVVPVAPPFGPALPIPQGRYEGPWGMGYSVVTTERENTDYLRKSLGDPNHTYKRTVTSILPNDYSGQPMQGPSLNFFP